jgi:5-methylthioribose kinase
MLELTANNTEAYLRDKGWVGPGPVRVELLSGGVSNAVLRVEIPERRLVLKQSRPQLRTRDAWFSDLDRVYREQEVMEFLQPLLPPPTVPAVLFSDRDNYVFAMEHAPLEAQPWKADLLAGKIEPALGEHAGRILGQMHQATAGHSGFASRFSDHTVFVQLRVEPFYQRVMERRPELAKEIAPIAAGLLTVKEAICHGDYTPKNLLVHAGRFTLVDYETAHYGDPTMDLGLFLTHLLLKAVRERERRADFLDLTSAFWHGYTDKVHFRPIADLVARAIPHLAVCLLARVDGTSPVEYLPEESKRERVRRLARWLLLERPTRWEDILVGVGGEE